MYNNMLEELRSKEREAHLQEKKDFSGRIQSLYKKARANLQEEIIEKKQMDSGIVNTWEYKINSLIRAIKESYAKMQVGEFQFYNIISTYNDACIYLKNIVKYSSLNQSYKLQFDQDFRKVLPALQDIEFYAIQVKNISEPAIQEMIKSIENKTYNTIGAELGVKTLKSGTLEKQLLLNKITSLREFIKSNKDKVTDRRQLAGLKEINKDLTKMKNKLSPNSVDWNRIEQQQKKKEAVDQFDEMNNVANTIIQPLLNAEEKAREEEKRIKEEEERDKLRQIQYEKERKEQQEEIDRLLKERKNIMARMGSPKKNSVLNLLNSLEGKQKTEQENVTNQEQNKDPDISSPLQQEMNLAQSPSVNMQLNKANNDQQQQLAPVLIEGSTEQKQPPSITLQTNSLLPEESREPLKQQFRRIDFPQKLEDPERKKVQVELELLTRGDFKEHIKILLSKYPQLRGLNSDVNMNLINKKYPHLFDEFEDEYNRIKIDSDGRVFNETIDAVLDNSPDDWKSDQKSFDSIIEYIKPILLAKYKVLRLQAIEINKDIESKIKTEILDKDLSDFELVQKNAEKKYILERNKWLNQLSKDTTKTEFDKFAKAKRERKEDFDTKLYWEVFKKYYDRR